MKDGAPVAPGEVGLSPDSCGLLGAKSVVPSGLLPWAWPPSALRMGWGGTHRPVGRQLRLLPSGDVFIRLGLFVDHFTFIEICFHYSRIANTRVISFLNPNKNVCVCVGGDFPEESSLVCPCPSEESHVHF